MSIEHNRLDVDCRHQKIKLTKSRHILGKQNFQTLHPFQKDTANKISNIMRRPQKIYRTRAIITRSRFEAALVYKPQILGFKKESRINGRSAS